MYEFKQAVKILDKTFRLGRHDVPNEIVAHPDFLHFVNCGWIAEVNPTKDPITLESFSERAQRLAKRLAEKSEPVREQVQETEDLGEEVPEEKLTTGQKAARTRAANKAKAEKGE